MMSSLLTDLCAVPFASLLSQHNNSDVVLVVEETHRLTLRARTLHPLTAFKKESSRYYPTHHTLLLLLVLISHYDHKL
jgi:hypothetical protein